MATSAKASDSSARKAEQCRPSRNNVWDVLAVQSLLHHERSLALTEMAARNLTQGLGVINSTLIQTHGAVSDDSGLIAALHTAAGAPRQGNNAKS